MDIIRKKRLFTCALLTILLVGCNGGSKDNQTPEFDVNTQFAATYLQSIGNDQAHPASAYTSKAAKTTQITQDKRYDGELEVTHVLTQEKELFDWPVTQKVDSDGNVETISHRSLTLKSGTYDFVLLLSSRDAQQRQYVAQALGEKIVDGEEPEIDFILQPNLGDTISDFDKVQYVSKLTFSWPAEDLAALTNPQFGLSINNDAETVYTINKETGIAEIIMNVEPGEYLLAMRLYDGNLMVGKSEDEDNRVNFVEGENAKMDVIPLQADVDFILDELKDEGLFSFVIPNEVVEEVGSAQDLTLIVRLGGDNVPAQEKVLEVEDVNGVYKASELFLTGGQGQITAYLAFHEQNEASEQFNSVPFASCNTAINVEINQTLGCKLELKRESIISGRILGTLMLSVLDKDWQPAIGAKVYINDKLVGLTGVEYNTGSLKAHLIAGEHDIEVRDSIYGASESLEIEPLAVENLLMYMEKHADIGDGHFVKHQSIRYQISEDKYSDAAVLADLNGNGHLDLVASRRNNSVLIFENDGKANFTKSEYSFADQRRTTDIVAADLNGNGHQDIVRSTTDGDQIFFNDGKGKLNDSGLLLGKGDSQSIAIGDLNANGYLDIVVGQKWKAPLVYFNDEQGSFIDSHEYLSGHSSAIHAANVVLADVNGNNRLDIIYGGGDNSTMIYLNEGEGRFSDSGQRLGISQKEKRFNVAVGDVNSSGKPDLLITNMDYSGTEQNTLYINDGNGVFDKSDVFVGVNGQAASFADVNSNGQLDLVVTGSYVEDAQLYFNDGNGNFTPSENGNFGKSHHTPLFGDLDGDGDLDLVLAYSTGSEIYLNQPVSR
ncbi:FG-GAP repeat domain-containing protein [Photobacterium minamisatsumaniensis]|uniref:FG-GAP repeat domain-containing protein n=1 Tax=Photobacterium minamisatsumaniensis TaxID=2910233 RepID=UPI003D0D3B84